MFMTGSKVFQFQKADNEVDGKHSERSKHKLCGFFFTMHFFIFRNCLWQCIFSFNTS